jgi:hypothetical protein
LRQTKKISRSLIIAGIAVVSIICIINILYADIIYTKDEICDICDNSAKYDVVTFDYLGVKVGNIYELCYVHDYVWSIGNPLIEGALLEGQLTLPAIFILSFIVCYLVLDMRTNSPSDPSDEIFKN